MRSLGTFFRAVRPKMLLFLGALLGLAQTVVRTLTDDRFPGTAADATFLWALAFPIFLGWMASRVIQEIRHCSFTWPLPGVRWKLAAGFFTVGTMASLLVVVWHRLSEHGWDPGVLFGVGFAAYCLGGMVEDPVSRPTAQISFALALSLLLFSGFWADLATDHPILLVGLIVPALAGACWMRMFGRPIFRQQPFLPTPGLVSWTLAERYERQKSLTNKPMPGRWSIRYLETDTWRWVRARWFEAWGNLPWKRSPGLRIAFVCLLLLATQALVEPGGRGAEAHGESFAQAFPRLVYSISFVPPDHPFFGEFTNPSMVVLLFVTIVGIGLAQKPPGTVERDRGYPLARHDRARISFWTHLATSILFVVGVSLCAFAFAQACGLWVGLPVRLDFVPHFLRCGLATMILMPGASWVELEARRLKSATYKSIRHALYMTAVWLLVGAWCFYVAERLPFPELELALLGSLIALSLWLYRLGLERHFATADLD